MYAQVGAAGWARALHAYCTVVDQHLFAYPLAPRSAFARYALALRMCALWPQLLVGGVALRVERALEQMLEVLSEQCAAAAASSVRADKAAAWPRLCCCGCFRWTHARRGTSESIRP